MTEEDDLEYLSMVTLPLVLLTVLQKMVTIIGRLVFASLDAL